ncbi:Ig-like domain-containing protein [Microbacterium sp.]|uniref:Ig-like domain-containing protein n=1 Tax=Microbacterium sp. TaxID=51671 RepID=UPI0039E6B49C
MRRRVAVGLSAGVAAVAVVTVVGIVWPGLDAQQTPPRDTSVWVLQTEGLRYGRVNTAIGELDTVRSVSNPSRLLDAAAGAYLFADSDTKVARIDEATPVDLDAAGLEGAASAPAGTVEVAAADDFVAYRTDTGAVFAGRLSAGTVAQVDPGGPEGDEPYTADAIAVDRRGMLFSFSRAAGGVLRFDVAASAVRGEDPLSARPQTPAISAAGDDWVVLDTADGRIWRRDGDAATLRTTGALAVGRPDPDADAVHVADEIGVVRIPAGSAEPETIYSGGTSSLGTPARPIVHDDAVLAAWLPEGSGPGTAWSSRDGPERLDYGAGTLPEQRRPVLVDTGDAVVLNDARSGWVWTMPDGRLLESTQDWILDDQPQSAPQLSEEQLPVMLEPKPPIAEPDVFGVRAGELVTLPVLLNDHDPNEDVLSVVAASVAGLDPAFGTVMVTDDDQRLAVRVAPDASGTATFTYAVTDGTTPDGLVSPATTVTLQAVGPDVESAPVWCGVIGCRQSWPTPQVRRGGTVTVPVLADWVDPEGDPTLLLSVVNESGIGSVAAGPGGDVVYQHDDDGSGGDERIELTVTVSDTRGGTATRTLAIDVRDEAAPLVQSFAVLDTVGSPLTVDVAGHVLGAAGEVSLTSARVLEDTTATTTIVPGTTQFDFSAPDPGVYRVALTVQAGGQEAKGTARITLLPPDAPPNLSTAPVVAFVRPQADATVDVFAAVSNPTRRVLLLSDVVPRPEPGATLSVDAVGQSHLRVSGSTATGEAGLLGTVAYRVSDGTSDTGASVEGEASVYLLPPAPDAAPIAVNDTVVVRVGAQVDIPVLANDIAASGTPPRIDPASVRSSTPDALAFASGELLRYLAPSSPGEFAIEYAVFSTGAPALQDTASVRVRVLADDANRAPLPENLSGRVINGMSTSIPFDGYGSDPDGDVVRLDRILDQPDAGSAAISADGTAIVYTSMPGDSGQHSFRYRVVDAFGATGEATVRVGVLGGDANPSPVTYTDYVQVQAGTGNVVRVRPLVNDLDPRGGALTVTGVQPDVPRFAHDGTPTAEYRRLEAQVVGVTGRTVTIAAGTEPSTMAFLYDVESASGNTARGLIVVKVVSGPVPDYPVVSDTVLTAADRDEFAVAGVDVLRGKVSWTGGEDDRLQVGLWGSPDGVRVDGTRLIGSLDAQTRIIPFSVTGRGTSGEVTTYAFLRVPAAAELALTLRRGLSPIEVEEAGETTFDLADLVVRERGAVLEVGADVRASGARPAASCERVSGTVVRYRAGAGAPWTDSCRVAVRLAGTSEWTFLSVPIAVSALDPQPSLTAASLTVGPGETTTYDLARLTVWQSRADWPSIRYAVDAFAPSFDVTLTGSDLTIVGHDDAVPGAEEYVTVRVTSHAAVDPVRVTLRVGAAPASLPQGGSVVQRCTQAIGSSCTIPVVGAIGEINPLSGTPLELVEVRPTGVCTGISFAVTSATEVTATWTSDAPGATCTASFTLRDAQGRPTSGERDGRLTLELQGFPQAPAALVQSAYADGSLTLRVDPGAASVAFPAITGFEVRSAGQTVAVCTPAGECPAIPAANGEQRTYEAVSVNAIGSSRQSATAVAWAYAPPAAPEAVSATPVVTSGAGGVVSLLVDGVDAANTGSLEIASPVGETAVVSVEPGQSQVALPSFVVGANTASPVTVTPRSRFAVPTGSGPGPDAGPVVVLAAGIGAPTQPALSLTATSAGGGLADIVATATAVPGGDAAQVRFGIVPDGQECTTSSDGQTRQFRGLPDGRLYTFVLCAESWFDGQSFGRVTVSADVRAVQSGAAPAGYTFVVGPVPHYDGDRANWTIDAEPTSAEPLPNENVARFSGYPSGVFDADPGITVRYEHVAGWWQSAWGAVGPAPGSAPYQVHANWWVEPCVGGSELVRQASSSGGLANVSFFADAVQYRDAAGALLPAGEDPWVVPVGAASVSGIGVRVDWSGQGWALDPAVASFSAVCTPNLPSAP